MKAPSRPSTDIPRQQGDFYVEPDCCLVCGVPEDIAPEIFRTSEEHCWVIRQPSSQDEIDRTIRAMWSSEVDCVRYRGQDEAILARLAKAGLADQADQGNALSTPVCGRDQVSFEFAEGSDFRNAGEIAKAFRDDMRNNGTKVLPALFGWRSVWVSWFQNRFHLVRFTDAGQGRFVARLRWTMSVQGLA